MNKTLKFVLGTASALVLGACSADSIDNPMVENWPSDFSVAEYAAVNPDLSILQCINEVSKANEKYAETKRTALKDSIRLVGANLKNTLMQGGLDMAAAEDSVKKAGLDSASAEAAAKKLKFTVDSTEWNVFFTGDENSVKTIFTDYARINADYWPLSGKSAFVQGVLDSVGNINIDGASALEYRTAFEDFHIFGNTADQDLAFLKAVVIDSELIEQQYIMAGKYEGRAYRFCREGEAVIKQLDVTVTYDTIKNADTTYIYDTVMVYDTSKTSLKYVVSYKDSTGADALDTLLQKALVDRQNLDSTIVVTDTLYDGAITSKPMAVKSDSTISDKIKRTTTTKPLSPNVIEPAGSKGRSWDFSQDLYCKDSNTGVIYLLGYQVAGNQPTANP